MTKKDEQRTNQKEFIIDLLSFFRGERFTAKEISEFLLENKLYVKTGAMSSAVIYNLINELPDVQKEKINGQYQYWIE